MGSEVLVYDMKGRVDMDINNPFLWMIGCVIAILLIWLGSVRTESRLNDEYNVFEQDCLNMQTDFPNLVKNVVHDAEDHNCTVILWDDTVHADQSIIQLQGMRAVMDSMMNMSAVPVPN